MQVEHYGKKIEVYFYQYGFQYKDKNTGELYGEVFDDNLTTGENAKSVRIDLQQSYAGSGYDDGSLPHIVWVKRISRAKAQKLLDACCIDMIGHHEVSKWVDR